MNRFMWKHKWTRSWYLIRCPLWCLPRFKTLLVDNLSPCSTSYCFPNIFRKENKWLRFINHFVPLISSLNHFGDLGSCSPKISLTVFHAITLLTLERQCGSHQQSNGTQKQANHRPHIRDREKNLFQSFRNEIPTIHPLEIIMILLPLKFSATKIYRHALMIAVLQKRFG